MPDTPALALGYITKDQNGTAYGRFEFLDDRTEMMQKWADYLDSLRNGDDTARFKNRDNLDPQQQLRQLISIIGKDKLLELIK